MGVRPPVSEFNVSAMPSQQMLLRLQSISLSGSEALHSQFSAMADAGGRTERGRAAREKERIVEAARAMQATQERIAAFQRKLDDIERASYEALIESEEKLRETRRAFEELRERAYEVSLPDGTIAKVYRDGDTMRDEDGREISRDVIDADTIDARWPTFAEFESRKRVVRDAVQNHEKIVEYHERVDAAQEAAKQQEISSDEIDALDIGLVQDIPVEVRSRMADEFKTDETRQGSAKPPRQDVSAPGPG